MRIFILLTVCSLFLSGYVFADNANLKQSSNIMLKGKTPQGVIVGKQKVTIKNGYVFEKVSDTKVISRMQGGGRGGIKLIDLLLTMFGVA